MKENSFSRAEPRHVLYSSNKDANTAQQGQADAATERNRARGGGMGRQWLVMRAESIAQTPDRHAEYDVPVG